MGDCDIVFSESIMPIISANCTGYCHTGTAPYTGGLNLESYSGLMAGGNSGDAVIPDSPDQSLIIQKLYGTAPGEQMPYQNLPLPDNQIAAIYYWIEQGAIGGDDDGWEDDCTEGLIEDCLDMCVDETLLGNGNCDNGEEGEADFNCIEFIFDQTDCPVGELDFGNSTYNNDNGTGSIEILMNCAFPVSSFEIELIGVSISGLSGGTSEDSQFDLSFTGSSFTGESVGFSNIDPNSGLLVVVEFDAIDPDIEEICFTNSLITTNIGVQYDAELGDCITIDQLGYIDINPEKFTISQIYPNPFNPNTTISYSIPTSQHVALNIYNLKGEKVETLVNGFHSLGNYYIDWNASGVASGIYLVQLKGTDNLATKKITLSK